MKNGPDASGSVPLEHRPNVHTYHQDGLSDQQKKETAIGDDSSSIEETIPHDHGLEERQDAVRGQVFAGTTGGGLGSAISRRLDNFLPPQKRYFNDRISRRTLLIIIGIAFLCLLALIIGLAAGLSSGGSSGPALPLPGGAQTYTGDLTYYNPGLGACGGTYGDNDAVVAISHFLWDKNQVGSNPNTNSFCGKKIRAQRVDERTGKLASVDLTVIDRCTGCKPTDLDVSPAMFNKLAAPALGRVNVEWAWL